MSGNVYGWFTRGRRNGKRNRAHDCSSDRQPPMFALLGRVAPYITRYNVAKTAYPQLNSLAALKSTSFSSHLRCMRLRDVSGIRQPPII